jgi:hypothetical protein
MSVVQVFFHLQPSRMQNCVHALIRYCCIYSNFLYSEYHSSFVEERYFILLSIVTIATSDPSLFSNSFGTFCCITQGEPLEISNLKLEILSIVANESNIQQVFAEISYCIAAPTASKNPDQAIIAIKILSQICGRIPSISDPSLTILIKALGRTSMISESVVAISRIIQVMPSAIDASVVRMLVGTLESVNDSVAKSAVFNIVARFCRSEARAVTLDTLRIGARRFKESGEEVKVAVLALGARVFVAFVGKENEVGGEVEIASQLFNYALDLADCDASYIVRDKAKFFRALSKQSSTLAEKVLFERRKPAGIENSMKGINVF